jgi:hypothetical protein
MINWMAEGWLDILFWLSYNSRNYIPFCVQYHVCEHKIHPRIRTITEEGSLSQTIVKIQS